MAFTKLTANVNNIQALNDRPNANTGLTADQVKSAFDQAGSDIKDYINNTLTPQLDSNSGLNLEIVNVMSYYASGLATTATGSITTGTKLLTLTTIPDFAAGQGINLEGVKEVASLQITAPASASANCTVTLNGVATTVALTSGDTAIQVATKIRAATYAGWTAGGTAGTDTVTFTSNTTGTKTDASYAVGTTGATGTTTTTTQGTADQISTVTSVSGLVVTIADNSTRTIAAGTIAHDDTVALQAAFTLTGNIVIPAGTYNVDAYTRLYIYSNTSVFFQNGAVLQARTTNQSSYRILFINNASNVTLYNPKVIGERSTHIGTTGEDGHGITISGTSDNVKVYNPNCSNCWGDGFVVYGGSNIYVENLYSNNNRRNNLTITNGTNVTFMNPTLTNANGTAPTAGLDIEPNTTADELININIINPITSGNDGAGISVGLAQFVGSTHHVTITITNHRDDSSYNGLVINRLGYSATGILTGRITYRDGILNNNDTNGIYIINYSAQNTPSIELLNPKVVNPNASTQVSAKYASGIAIIREIAATETNSMGNTLITNPDVRDKRAVVKMLRGIYCADEKSISGELIKIINPVAMDGVALREKIQFALGGVTLIDGNSVCSADYTSASVAFAEAGYTRVGNNGTATKVAFTLNSATVINDAPITFIVRNVLGIRVIPPTGVAILPLSAVNGKYIESIVLGASITIRRLSSTQWIVVAMNGTWTVEP